MSNLIAFVKRNPARVYSGIVAGIALACSFGLSWSAQQVGAVTAFVALILGEPVRRSVKPRTR